MSGVWKLDPLEEPTQKPEPSVSLATRLTVEVGGAETTMELRVASGQLWQRFHSCSPLGVPPPGHSSSTS